MPIIYTYPTVTPTANDLVLLTDTSDSQKATKSATIASVIGLGTDVVYDLQTVFNNGTISTTSNNVVASISHDIDVTCSGGGKKIKFATTAETTPIQLHTTHSDIELSTNGVGEVKLLAGGTGDITFNGTSAVRTKKVILSNANMQALYNGAGVQVPIELVADPGAGKAIQVLSLYGFLDYTAPAFNAVDLRIRSFGSSSYLGEFDTPFTSSSADKKETWKVLSPGSWIENTKIEIYATGDIGTGGSTLTVYITYIVIDT